jgi:hypothetical protein
MIDPRAIGRAILTHYNSLLLRDKPNAPVKPV